MFHSPQRYAFYALITFLVCAPVAHAQKHPECGEWYAECMDGAYKLPGSISDQSSTFYKAYRQCGATSSACEFRDDDCSYALPSLDGFFSGSTGVPPPSCPSPSPSSSPAPTPVPTPTPVRSRSSAVSQKPVAVTAASIADIHGGDSSDVQINVGGKGEFVPLTKDVQVRVGDVITTGYDNFVTLKFAGSELFVTPLTQVSITERLLNDSTHRNSVQTSLLVGWVKPIVKHIPGIRSDFSVATPTCITSIRGSAAIIGYDPRTKISTVFVTEDKAIVSPAKGKGKKVTVKEGKKVTVGANGKISKVQSFTKEELPKGM